MLRRRTWLKLIAALAAMPAGEAQTALDQPAPRVSKEMVVAALATMGLSFHRSAARNDAAGGEPARSTLRAAAEARYSARYRPAISFSPVLPGFAVPRGASVYPSRQSAGPHPIRPAGRTGVSSRRPTGRDDPGAANHLHRAHEDVSGAAENLRAQAATASSL